MFLVRPSQHLFANVFLYLFLSIFAYEVIYINIMHASILGELISSSQAGDVNKVGSDPDKMYTSCQDHCVLYTPMQAIYTIQMNTIFLPLCG